MKNIFLFTAITLMSLSTIAQVQNHLSSSGTDKTFFKTTNTNSLSGGLQLGINNGNTNGNPGFINLKENRHLYFSTNNAERLRILRTGEVGIGTATPSELLDVNGNGRFRLITFGQNDFLTTHDNTGVFHKIAFTGNPNDVLLGDGTFGPGQGSSATDADWFDITNLNNAPTDINNGIYTFGNVGIGTDSPTADLHVDKPTGGNIAVFTVSGRDGTNTTNDNAFTFDAGNNGVPTRFTVTGRQAPGTILARKDFGGQGINLNSQMSGTNGVGIEPVGTNTLYLGGQNILPNSTGTGNAGVNLGNAATSRTFRSFGVDKDFVIEQELGSSSLVSSFTIKLGNQRDDAAQGKRGIVIRPSETITNTLGDGTEYNRAHYFSVANNQGSINATNSKTLFTIGPKGSVGVGLGGTELSPVSPSCAIDVNGDVCANGIVLSSDARFKKDIARLSDPLDKLSKIRGVSYLFNKENFKQREFSDQKQYGVVAQEIEKVFPELVFTKKDGYKAVNYIQLIPFLIEATKEQQQIIESQNKKIESLEKEMKNPEIAELKREIDALKELIVASNRNISVETIEVWLDKEGQSIYLGQNIPNPFKEFTTISYFLPENINAATIEIYDLQGKLLKSEPLKVGKGNVKVYSSGLTNGTYVYTIIADGKIMESKRMVLNN